MRRERSSARSGHPLVEILAVFLRLGLTSFGGPIAHIGYFRRAFVERRCWLTDAEFGQLLAICQFLPGPASSQMGFAVALLRAGWAGALLAFLAFTLPSAVLLVAFAGLLPHLQGGAGADALHGLKLVALAVVSHGLLGMTKQLTPDLPRGIIAAVAAAFMLVVGAAWAQLAVVAFGAIAGLAACRSVPPVAGAELRAPFGPRTGVALVVAFFALLAGMPLLARGADGLLAVAAAFTRSGALVFGGGHVVLPLLQETVVAPGWVSREEFLAGYGAAQAVPGPMFSLAAYLGARLPGADGGLPGAAVALVSIFLPGLLLVAGVLPLWREAARHRNAPRAVAGVNAAVVGLLAAALYDPVWTGAAHGPWDVVIALAGFLVLASRRGGPIHVVIGCVAARVAVGLLQ